MSWPQALIAHAVKVAIVVALLGAFRRGHAQRCWTFVVYLGVIAVCNALVTTWPDSFYNATFWLLKQSAYDVLKLAIAIEMGYRVVRAFPGAAVGARTVALVALIVSLGVILTGDVYQAYEAQWAFQPQILAAAVWLFALCALLATWYHLPLDDWHRAIIMGFAAYLLLFVSLLNVLKHNGWGAWRYASMLDSVGYLALVSWWAWASWQPAREPIAVEDAVERLASPAPRRA